MKAITAVLFVLSVAVFAAKDDRRIKAHRVPHEIRFQEWMVKYNKVYTTQVEYDLRLKNFIAYTKKVAQLNAQSKALNSTATFAVNKFADLSPEEFSALLGMKGYKPHNIPGVPVAKVTGSAPPSYDWRANGITAIKDQGQCGSCWAFSCTESIESAYMIKGGKGKKQVPLAPQQIVDCDQVDQGCNGGDLPSCYQYVQSAGGLEPESSYPYKARDGKCSANKGQEEDPISGFKYVIPQGSTDENTMASFLAANQPMSIIVDASVWSSYSGGVLTGDQCGDDLDHAVQAVGYKGLDANGYWIVRNSWGADWGEAGFIRLQFGANTCGLTSEVTVPSI